MNKTKIEWVRNPDGSPGYTLNPMSGCENHTPEGLCLDGLFPCYAYKLANGRLKPLYLANRALAGLDWVDGVPIVAGREKYDRLLEAKTDPFYPRFWEERLEELERGIDALDYQTYIRQKAKGIFVCDMGDLFGVGIPERWTRRILEVIGDDANSIHRFYLLTKQAQRLPEFSPFPENCWVGVTATTDAAYQAATFHLEQVQATVRFISFEPLLSPIDCYHAWDKRMERLIDWLVIGACTGTEKEMSYLAGRHRPFLTEMPWGNRWTAQPSIEWVREIVQAADRAGIRVFLKDNLLELVNYHSPETDFAFKDGCYRQEMPETP